MIPSREIPVALALPFQALIRLAQLSLCSGIKLASDWWRRLLIEQ